MKKVDTSIPYGGSADPVSQLQESNIELEEVVNRSYQVNQYYSYYYRSEWHDKSWNMEPVALRMFICFAYD